MEALSSIIAAHPQAVVAVLGALLVHLRAVVPAGRPGTVWGVVTSLWDALAGNYGHARNAPVQDKQDSEVSDALDG